MVCVLPIDEYLHRQLKVPRRAICGLNELLCVVHYLIANICLVALQKAVSLLLQRFVSDWRSFEISMRPRITSRGIPSLCVRHVEAEPLVLHSNVHEARVFVPEDTLVTCQSKDGWQS